MVIIDMGRQKGYSRDTILEQAMMVFWEKGYSKTSMSDLATATGVDKKCIFREFTNKQGLFEQVLRLYCDWDAKYFEELFTTRPLGKTNIKKFLEDLISEHNEQGCLLNKSIVQRNHISDSHFSIIKKTIDRLEKYLLDNIQAAQQVGQIKKSVDAKALAKYLIYCSQGISSMSEYPGSNKDSEAVVSVILAVL